ncbi:MAG: hypothetical protein QM765_31515 [Myxococcales bacterium]
MNATLHFLMWLSVGVWSCGVLGLLLSVVERVARYLSAAWVLRVGPVVLRQVVDLDLPEILTSERGALGALAYRKLGDEVWGCHLRMSFFAFHTPFPLAATLQPEGGRAILIGRLPLGPTIFHGAGVAFALLFLLSAGLGARNLQVVASVLGALVLVALLVFGFICLERRRFLKVIEQLTKSPSRLPRG